MANQPTFAPKNRKPGQPYVTAVSVLVKMDDGRFRYVKLGAEQSTKLFRFMVENVCRGTLDLSKPLSAEDSLETPQPLNRMILPG